MLDSLTLAHFERLIGTPFTLTAEGATGSLQLSLSAATRVGAATKPGGRDQFALHFTGPGHIVLPQQIYHLESDALEPLDLFLVPIGRDANGVQYEAIFT